MIKIAHESPKSIFKKVQEYTDYDYALVHLFEEDEEYFNLFKEALENGREVILDNSIFELEEAFDADKFDKWINYLKPSWYIVPDALEDAYKTIDQMEDWNNRGLGYEGSGKIGVVQGKEYDEIVDCYNYMKNEANVDMIAISFDYSYYEWTSPHTNKYVSWMLGRPALLGRMLYDGVIDTNMKHHLLGVGLPQEGLFYKHSDYDWIYSMDTSNPVVHGMKGIEYSDQGLWDKESQKLFELINTPAPIDNRAFWNIQRFRTFWNKPEASLF